jgi:hypothetical protein
MALFLCPIFADNAQPQLLYRNQNLISLLSSCVVFSSPGFRQKDQEYRFRWSCATSLTEAEFPRRTLGYFGGHFGLRGSFAACPGAHILMKTSP